MDILSNLNKTTTKQGRRCGRGIGSGLGGHTSGRGAKGDKARGKTDLAFAGTKHKKSWIKRLPFMRGKHRLESHTNIVNINLSQIDKWFKANEIVDAGSLAQKSKITVKNLNGGFKILATGDITKALTFKGISLSENSKKKIIAAGGNIE